MPSRRHWTTVPNFFYFMHGSIKWNKIILKNFCNFQCFILTWNHVWNEIVYILTHIDGTIGPIQYFSALHQEDHGTDAWLFLYMASVYSSAFAPPTTNKIGAMVPAYYSMTRICFDQNQSTQTECNWILKAQSIARA